jgi:predicted PurR-regulated permease PerM
VNQKWLTKVFFFAILLFLLYIALQVLSPFIVAITWATILAILFYPIYEWLLKALRGRSSGAALIVIVLIILVIIIPGLKIIGFLTEEAVELGQAVRDFVTGEGIKVWQEKPWVKDLLRWWDLLSFRLDMFKINWKEPLVQGAQVTSVFVVTYARNVAQNVLLFAINFILTLFTLFFFLRDGKDFCDRIRRLLPMDSEHQERLFNKIVDAITAVVQGSLVVATLQGFLAGVAYWLLGVPFAAIWGVATAFMGLLPIGGTALVTIPVSIYLFLQSDTWRGVAMLIWSLGIVGMVDNLVKPLFIGSRLQLPVLVLFFSILGGISVFGALGLILGPVLFALLAAVLDLYLEEYGSETT